MKTYKQFKEDIGNLIQRRQDAADKANSTQDYESQKRNAYNDEKQRKLERTQLIADIKAALNNSQD